MIRQARAPQAPRAGAARPGPGATITAELPVVTAAGLVRPERGPRARRRSAPYLVRLVVWLLVFVLVCMLAGAAVEHYHPSWLDFLRNHASPVVAAGPARARASVAGGTAPRSTHAPASGFRLLDEGARGASYEVPAHSYSIVVTTSHPCWTQVAEPAGSATLAYAETVQPSASPKAFGVTGSASVVVDAAAESVAVEIRGVTVGTIHLPRLGYAYSFSPSGA
ncbi:MAG: hypothetical protein ACYCXY_09295 [Acidimicrobiales bacterium]